MSLLLVIMIYSSLGFGLHTHLMQVHRSTQPSAVRGRTAKRTLAFRLINNRVLVMMDVYDSSPRADQRTKWLGLRVGGHLALSYIHIMNRVNSCGCAVTTP